MLQYFSVEKEFAFRYTWYYCSVNIVPTTLTLYLLRVLDIPNQDNMFHWVLCPQRGKEIIPLNAAKINVESIAVDVCNKI